MTPPLNESRESPSTPESLLLVGPSSIQTCSHEVLPPKRPTPPDPSS